MTINQLQCFVAVAKELNYAKAAKTLFLSTSAISRQIKALEDDLGVELFFRNRQYVMLTPAGTRFYTEASDILERIQLTRDNILKQPGSETLHLGFISSIQVRNLNQIYREYHTLMPNIMVNNTLITPQNYQRLILSERQDIFFIPCEGTHKDAFITPSHKYCSLYKGSLCCVMPKGHRLSDRKLLSSTDLSGETLILLDHEHCSPAMDEVQMEIRRAGKNLTYFYSGSSFFTTPMIEGGLGIAVMPDFVCPHSAELVKVPFASAQQWEYGLVWRSDDKSEKVRRFIEVARRLCKA